MNDIIGLKKGFKPSRYNEVSKNGAAKANSIAIRNAEIVKAYNEFFKVDKEE